MSAAELPYRKLIGVKFNCPVARATQFWPDNGSLNSTLYPRVFKLISI